jgi:hypothetical protein
VRALAAVIGESPEERSVVDVLTERGKADGVAIDVGVAVLHHPVVI